LEVEDFETRLLRLMSLVRNIYSVCIEVCIVSEGKYQRLSTLSEWAGLMETGHVTAGVTG